MSAIGIYDGRLYNFLPSTIQTAQYPNSSGDKQSNLNQYTIEHEILYSLDILPTQVFSIEDVLKSLYIVLAHRKEQLVYSNREYHDYGHVMFTIYVSNPFVSSDYGKIRFFDFASM